MKMNGENGDGKREKGKYTNLFLLETSRFALYTAKYLACHVDLNTTIWLHKIPT